jgi:dipeptidyl aminopeptidase/acylaminoacyl peptidase
MDVVDLLKARSAQALDLDAAGRILIRSDLTGTFQLYEILGPELRQLTDFEDGVTGRYVPGTRHAVAQMDRGGNERHQLYRFDLDAPPGADAGRLEPLAVSPEHMQPLVGVSRDGGQLAYVSNRRNGVDFDVFVLDLTTLEERCVYEGGGWAHGSSGFSPDGRFLSFMLPGDRPLDVGLRVVDLTTGELSEVLPHPHEAALVGPPAWTTATTFFTSSNVGRDLAAIVLHDLATGETTTVLEQPFDLECYSSADGGTLLVIANEGGADRLTLFGVDGAALHPLGEIELPEAGIVTLPFVTPPVVPLVSAHGDGVVLTYGSPRRTTDVWAFDRTAGALARLTASPGPDPDAEGLVMPTVHTVESFDGEPVPLFLYRGDKEGDAPPPVVMVVHGGPEAQATMRFDPRVQALVGDGFAVVVPNVRGSTGYGKRYAALDDTTRRLDSVADMAAIHAWMPTVGLDASRAALMGGSYGGYMVLAGVAFQPELWAAGVVGVGISNLVTFLQNTSSYRRAHREREYGSLEHDREFLERASPMSRVDDIRAPLFLMHGENDPRVPVSEARQLAAALADRGVRCELIVFPDEGHGLTKLPNILEAIPRSLAFLVEVLKS